MPNPAQQRYLIEHGVTRPFWNGLTVTGKIEGRGRMIAEMPFPELQRIVVEDIGGLALGHLKKGLLRAHGVDEGGEPDKGIGGHDVMWFVARDLAFGADAHPDHRAAGGHRPTGGRGALHAGTRHALRDGAALSDEPAAHRVPRRDRLRQLAGDVSDAGLFGDRGADALEAAEIIERIRTDEKIHVESLRLYLGELRSLTVKTVDGGTIAGALLIDRFWTGLLDWATVKQPRLAAENQHGVLKEEIVTHENGASILRGFNALADPGYSWAESNG